MQCMLRQVQERRHTREEHQQAAGRGSAREAPEQGADRQREAMHEQALRQPNNRQQTVLPNQGGQVYWGAGLDIRRRTSAVQGMLHEVQERRHAREAQQQGWTKVHHPFHDEFLAFLLLFGLVRWAIIRHRVLWARHILCEPSWHAWESISCQQGR